MALTFLPFRPKSQFHCGLLKMPTSYCIWETVSPQTVYRPLEALRGVVLLLNTWPVEGMCAWCSDAFILSPFLLIKRLLVTFVPPGSTCCHRCLLAMVTYAVTGVPVVPAFAYGFRN